MREWIKSLNKIEKDKVYVWDSVIGEKINTLDEYYRLNEWLIRCCDMGYAEMDDIADYIGKREFNKKFTCLRIIRNNDNISCRTVRVLLPIDWIQDKLGKRCFSVWVRRYTLQETCEFYGDGKRDGVLFEIGKSG